MKKLSQHYTILWGMLKQPKKKWFSAVDFQSGKYFVGYEASARISEIAYKYPLVVERMTDGKYRYIRIRWENKKEVQDIKELIETLLKSQK